MPKILSLQSVSKKTVFPKEILFLLVLHFVRLPAGR